MKRVLISLITFAVGGIILGVMVFANQIGIDHNVQWGKGRIIGALAGILFIVFALIIFLYFDHLSAWIKIIKTPRLWNYLAHHRMELIYSSAGLVGIIVLIIYVWFISVGTWTNWPRTHDYKGYFDQLGTAFDQGKLYIQMKPAPELLSLSDPYDPLVRKQIPRSDTLDIFDLSLYKGRLYLYWGPVPALIIAIIKPFFSVEVSDQYLVFAFALCLFLFQSLLIIKIWSDFFHQLPGWTLLIMVFLGGLINPIPWMLSQPRTYETAIVCGQLFFIAGIYFAYSALSKLFPSKPQLAMSGFSWACAVGSRAILLIPIAFLVFMIILLLFTKKYHLKKINLEGLLSVIALGLPLVIGGILLGWYNWARFGSVFELGFRYQITMLNINKYNNGIFSLAYLPANLYVYFLNPPNLIAIFPFIKPAMAGESSILYSHLPENYVTEHITGPIFALPFIVFGVVATVTMGSERLSEKLSNESTGTQPKLYKWVLLSLIGSFAIALLSMLLYFYASQRFLEDIMPLAFLISTLGFWQGYSLLNKNLFHRIAYSLLVVILVCISIISSFLLSFSADITRIRSTNPALLINLILFCLKIKRIL
ncbi:MAG: hypothetical protein WAN58_21110 [Anaerolineales bacterium]